MSKNDSFISSLLNDINIFNLEWLHVIQLTFSEAILIFFWIKYTFLILYDLYFSLRSPVGIFQDDTCYKIQGDDNHKMNLSSLPK